MPLTLFARCPGLPLLPPPHPVSPWLELHHSRGNIKKPTPLTHALILWPKEAKTP